MGDRLISISKEISKLHESVFVGNISEAIKNIDFFKGEFVIVISPEEKDFTESDYSIVESVNNYVKCGLTLMDAMKKVAKERHISKSLIYKEYHRE